MNDPRRFGGPTNLPTLRGTRVLKPDSGLFRENDQPRTAAQLLERAHRNAIKIRTHGVTGIGKDILAGLIADDIAEALRLSRAAREKKEGAA